MQKIQGFSMTVPTTTAQAKGLPKMKATSTWSAPTKDSATARLVCVNASMATLASPALAKLARTTALGMVHAKR